MMMRRPPEYIGSAKVIHYAFNHENIEFVNAIKLIVNGRRLGEVPALAICQSNDKYVLIFCNAHWLNVGIIEVSSIDEAKQIAETSYKGLSWVVCKSKTELNPSSWPKHVCAFCGKSSGEVFRVYSSDNSAICNECIQLLNGFVLEDMECSANGKP